MKIPNLQKLSLALYISFLLGLYGCGGGSASNGSGGGGGNGGGSNNPPAPTLTSLSPFAGPINTSVIVAVGGNNFVSTSTIAINGLSISSCTVKSSIEIDCVVPAYAVALPGNVNFTVTTPAPGGGTSSLLPYTAYVAIADNDIVYRPQDGLLYTSEISSGAGGGGNAIVGIDPVTGSIMRQIWVGSNPNQLALSSDGTQLFVGLDGAGSVAQVDLNKGRIVQQFYLGGGTTLDGIVNTAEFIAAVPGSPNSVAVGLSGYDSGQNGVLIYDSGVARPTMLTGVGSGPMSFGPSASTLYMQYGDTIYQLSVDSTGIKSSKILATVQGYLYNIQYDNGQLYLSNGQVLDAITGALVGTFTGSGGKSIHGPVVSDSTLGRAFIAFDNSNDWGQMLAFNEANYSSIGSIAVNGVGTGGYGTDFRKIVRWGQNGIAMNDAPPPFTSVSQIFLYQSSLVKDVSATPADLAVTLSSPATGTTGTALQWTAKIINSGPNQAQGVTFTLNLDPSLIVNSVSPSQGYCGSGTEFTCNLGNLSEGATTNVTISTTPTTSETLTGIGIVSSTSYDPATNNNLSTASTAVTGNLYSAVPSISSISPYYIQAGSSSFTINVFGEGFNPNSIVYFGTTALATTYLKSTEIEASVPASVVANYGWAGITVANPAPGGGTSQITPFTIYSVVNLPASGLLFEPYTQQLYVTIPSYATGITGNSVSTINPFTGVIGTPIPVGSEPNVMAETTDGKYLYIGLSGSNSLAQFNLLNQSVSTTIPITISSTSYPATWLSVMPGTDTTLAVQTGPDAGNVGIFDITGNTGQFRPNFTPVYTGYDPVFANSSEFYTCDNSSLFYRYSVDANGATSIDSTKMIGIDGLGVSCSVANGLVYAAGGGIINPATTPPTQVAALQLFEYTQGTLPYAAGTVVDQSVNKEYMILQNEAGFYSYGLARYDLNTYNPEAFIDLPVSSPSYGSSWNLVRFGQDGLALLSTSNDLTTNEPTTFIELVRGPFVTPQLLNKSTAATLTASSPNSITHGSSNVMLTLTGTNLQPGVAVTWNGSYRSTSWVSATQATVYIPASDLTTAKSATLVATNPGASGSNSIQVTIN